MKIYISHNFSAREVLFEPVVKQLEEMGHEIVSTWLWHDLESITKRRAAEQDLEDMKRAHAVLFFMDQHGKSAGRGKYFELGVAYQMGKQVYLYGSDASYDTCVFYHLPMFSRIYDLRQLGKVN